MGSVAAWILWQGSLDGLDCVLYLVVDWAMN